MALRQAIGAGSAIGPRMENAGHALGITGGHCDENGYRPGLVDTDYREGVADGADEIRKAVRYQVKYGADVIKICATGGVLSEGDAVGATQYTLDEMKAAVDEAAKLDRKVAAHAHGTEGIKLAVRAGVASIEHGSFLDDEGARLMVQKGTYLVPTISAGEFVENAAKSGRLRGCAPRRRSPPRRECATRCASPTASGFPSRSAPTRVLASTARTATSSRCSSRGAGSLQCRPSRRGRRTPRSCSAGEERRHARAR